MNGTLRLLKIAGIPVRVHWSFGILYLALIFWGWRSGLTSLQIVLACLLVAVLFVCVVLHELGHARMADFYQIRTHDIIILPIGGVARLDRLPDKPINEFFVALAGPAVNLIIALVALMVIVVVWGAHPWYMLESISDIRPINSPYGFLTNLWQANILLAAFNMIPAFPLDGGRVFRALLSMRLGRVRATKIASWIGQAFAIAIFFHGLWMGDIIEIAIAAFVFFTASNELRGVITDQLLSEYTVADIMRQEFTRYGVRDNFEMPFDKLKAGVESSFLVFDTSGTLAGILEEEAITKAGEDNRLSESIEPHLSAQYAVISATAPALKAFSLMQQNDYSLLIVETGDGIAGVIDDNTLDALIKLVKKRRKTIS